SGKTIEYGWPSMAASASMPPTPQPRTASPLTIVVWESVPTTVSGYATSMLVGLPASLTVSFFDQIVCERDSRLTWLPVPVPGGNEPEIVERLLRPLEELITFEVLLVLFLDVLLERGITAGEVDLDGMVDHEVDWNQGIDFFRIASQGFHGVAHRSEINDRRNA